MFSRNQKEKKLQQQIKDRLVDWSVDPFYVHTHTYIQTLALPYHVYVPHTMDCVLSEWRTTADIPS